jgi:hypothetical protein
MNDLAYKAAFILFFTTVFTHPSFAHAEQYICVAEQSTGFKYDEVAKTWISTSFNTRDSYLVFEPENPRYEFQVKQIGENAVTASCRQGFDRSGHLSCTGFFGDIYFKFNRRNNRFLYVYAHGYFTDHPDIESNMPFMQIGTCSRF